MCSKQRFIKQEDVENLYENLTWKQLASDEKREIGIAFIGKALYDSVASDHLDSLRNSSHHDSIYFADRMEEIRQ